jgi:hypothetical protein
MWKACAHTPIQKLATNLWRVESDMGRPPMRRAMDVVRRPNGDLWIHNAVAVSEEAMKELEAWGTPAVLLVPSGFHRMDPAQFKARYPRLKVYAPKGSVERVREKVAVDGSFDDLPCETDVAIEPIAGVGDKEAAVVVTSEDGASILLCDAVFNMAHRTGVNGLVLKVIGSSGGPRVTRIFKLAVLKDKKAFKESMLRLAATPRLKRVLVQHEDAMTPAELRAAIEEL